MTPTLDAVALAPEITLVVALLAAFVLDLFVGEENKRWVGVLAAIGTLAAFGAVIAVAVSGTTASMAAGVYVVDDFALVAKGILLASGAVILMMGMPKGWKGEYTFLVLSSLLGMVMLPSARDLLTFFVAFELLAIPGYMLAGWDKRSRYGHEAALKFYLLGVLATAVLLYGLSLLYGVAGSTLFVDIAATVTDEVAGIPLVALAVLFVVVGMAFKVAAVPFHFWAPDAYQGAPLPVAAFLSVASKAAAMVGLLTLVAVALPNAGSVWAPLLWGLAAVTMTVGNLIALRQTDMVRLLAYSSIAQAGYLLVPLAVAVRYGGTFQLAIESTFVFLIIYAAMNIGAFAVVMGVVQRTGNSSIAAFKGLFHAAPALAVLLSAHLLSLAGIPPLGGWFAKLVIFRAAIEAGGAAAISLAVVAAVNTAIGLVYYALVIRQMWLEPAPSQADVQSTSPPQLGVGLVAVLAITTSVVVITGVLPGLVTHIGGLSSLGS